jgi:alpha-beta hydrolase superfamily lysophospholipase
VILLIHGLGDHGGRFRPFAERMTRRGWSVFAIDLPGHGLSPGRRGTARRYDEVLEIIAAARRRLREQFGDQRQILLGHSMGGNFALNYTLRRSEFDDGAVPAVAGLVLVAPMLMPPAFLDRSKIFAAWGTGQLLRWVRISKPARTEQLTRDAENARRIETDRLQHHQISLYLATQLLAQGRFALDHAGQIQTPTLVLYGDEDELIDRAACRNLTLRMRAAAELVCWPGGRHDLVNDVDAEAVADRLASWLPAPRRATRAIAA